MVPQQVVGHTSLSYLCVIRGNPRIFNPLSILSGIRSVPVDRIATVLIIYFAAALCPIWSVVFLTCTSLSPSATLRNSSKHMFEMHGALTLFALQQYYKTITG